MRNLEYTHSIDNINVKTNVELLGLRNIKGKYLFLNNLHCQQLINEYAFHELTGLDIPLVCYANLNLHLVALGILVSS